VESVDSGDVPEIGVIVSRALLIDWNGASRFPAGGNAVKPNHGVRELQQSPERVQTKNIFVFDANVNRL
jgi:hypothetical protein